MRSKKAVINIFTNLLFQIVVIIYGFIVPRLIIGYYGSDVNGLISSITQFLAYITLLESGFGPVVKSLLYKPIAEKDEGTIRNILKTSESFFRKIAIIFCFYIVLLCIIYPLIVAESFSWIYTASLIVIIGISTFAEYFFGMTYSLYLQAKQNNYIISIIQIITYIVSIIIVVILVRFSVSIHIIKLVCGLTFMLRPIIQNFYVKKKYKINFTDCNDKFDLKQKWDGLAQHIAAVIHSNTDITILTIFTDLIEVSVYSIYYLVVKGIKSIIQAFTNGIDASFGDIIAKNEKKNLIVKFNIYEIVYNTVLVILFSSTMILIIPFVSVYTLNVTDANYIRPLFGLLLVISEYIWAIRLPYSSITLAAGHFKETRKGAWIECISNIIISIVLVKKYGIVGVAIGTIFAMTIRTIEFIYHTNKYILSRSIWESFKKIIIVVINTLLIVVICNNLPFKENINYVNWIINALMVVSTACVISMTVNYLLFKKEFLYLFTLLKRRVNNTTKTTEKSNLKGEQK